MSSLLSAPNVICFFAFLVVPICWYFLWVDSRSKGRPNLILPIIALGAVTLYFSVEACIVHWSWFMFPYHDLIGVSLFVLTLWIFLLTGAVGVFSLRQKLGRAMILVTVTYLSWWAYVVTHADL